MTACQTLQYNPYFISKESSSNSSYINYIFLGKHDLPLPILSGQREMPKQQKSCESRHPGPNCQKPSTRSWFVNRSHHFTGNLIPASVFPRPNCWQTFAEWSPAFTLPFISHITVLRGYEGLIFRTIFWEEEGTATLKWKQCAPRCSRSLPCPPAVHSRSCGEAVSPSTSHRLWKAKPLLLGSLISTMSKRSHTCGPFKEAL